MAVLLSCPETIFRLSMSTWKNEHIPVAKNNFIKVELETWNLIPLSLGLHMYCRRYTSTFELRLCASMLHVAI
jgi:hypothetical protein